MNGTSEDERYQAAKKRVDELKGFYIHLAVYILVNTMLLVINLISSPGGLWFYWATIPWGIGLIIHALTVFVFEGGLLGRKWEEKKIRQFMDKD